MHIAAPSLGRLKFIGKVRRAAPAHLAPGHFDAAKTCKIQCADKAFATEGSQRTRVRFISPSLDILLGLFASNREIAILRSGNYRVFARTRAANFRLADRANRRLLRGISQS
jgi:hypothetical protein